MRRRGGCGGAVTAAADRRQRCASGRAAAESLHASHGRDFVHGSGGLVWIRRGIDGFGGVWAGLKSAPGLTERRDSGRPGLKLGRCDPTGLAGIGPRIRPGWG